MHVVDWMTRCGRGSNMYTDERELEGAGFRRSEILLKHCQMFYVKTFKTINVTDTDELFTITCI